MLCKLIFTGQHPDRAETVLVSADHCRPCMSLFLGLITSARVTPARCIFILLWLVCMILKLQCQHEGMARFMSSIATSSLHKVQIQISTSPSTHAYAFGTN